MSSDSHTDSIIDPDILAERARQLKMRKVNHGFILFGSLTGMFGLNWILWTAYSALLVRGKMSECLRGESHYGGSPSGYSFSYRDYTTDRVNPCRDAAQTSTDFLQPLMMAFVLGLTLLLFWYLWDQNKHAIMNTWNITKWTCDTVMSIVGFVGLVTTAVTAICLMLTACTALMQLQSAA